MTERCCKYREWLAAASFDELEPRRRAELDAHLAGCPGCRRYGESMDTDHRRLQALAADVDDGMEALAIRIADQLAQGSEDQVGPATAPSGNLLRRPWLRLALAASVAVAAFLGLDLVGGDQVGGVAWADVMARVEDAQDFICRRIEKRSGEPAQEMVEYRSARFGLRQDIRVNGELQAEQFIIPAEKTLYAVIHRDRTYMRQSLNDEQIETMREQGNARAMVASFKEYDYTSLGRRRIDGRLAEGIEVRDPREWRTLFESGVWRLWVDLETQWPVLMELEGTARGGKVHKTYTLKDFQWNAPLTADDFTVEIPDDYTLIADLAANVADEEHALTGLRAYARLLGGRYPSVLSMSTAIAEAEQELDRRHSGYTEAAGKDLEALFLIRNTCNFFNELESAARRPRYHGDRVRADDLDQVLMSWRLDDGRWRVVYGDLRTSTLETLSVNR